MAGDRITRVTRAVTKSRNLEEIEVRTCICTWLALSKPKKCFHAAVSVPEQRVFSHKIVFRQKNLLAGILRRQNFPERTLKVTRKICNRYAQHTLLPYTVNTTTADPHARGSAAHPTKSFLGYDTRCVSVLPSLD